MIWKILLIGGFPSEGVCFNWATLSNCGSIRYRFSKILQYSSEIVSCWFSLDVSDEHITGSAGFRLFYHILVVSTPAFLLFLKLDGVGPVDNRPSTD